MPKARSTVKPLTILPDASSEEQAHARGLHEGMSRKVNRIRQEVAKRHALGEAMKKKIGRREKRIAELLRENVILRAWIARIARAQDADRNWQGLGSWTREALKSAIAEADGAEHNEVRTQ